MAKIKHLFNNGVQEQAIKRVKKYIADENYVDAKDEIEKVLAVNPSDDRALNLLAIVMLKLEQFDRAVRIYEDLITRYPKTLPLHINLGVAYLKNNQCENAIKEFSFVLDKEPDNKTVLKLYGKSLLKLNRVEEAIEMFKKAGMDEYIKSLKQKKETKGTLEPELSTEDIIEGAEVKSVEKDIDAGEQQTLVEGQTSSEGVFFSKENQSETKEEDLSERIQKQEKSKDETIQAEAQTEETTIEEEISSEQYNEEGIIESERGPSAIREQELIEQYSGLMDQSQEEKYASTGEQPIKNEQSIDKERSEEQAKEEPIEKEKTISEHIEANQTYGDGESNREEQSTIEGQKRLVEQEISEDQKILSEEEIQTEKINEGLSFITETTTLSKYNAPVNFIHNSLLTFNLNGNIIYVRDKGIIALNEGLTIEQAYKRYRGKDTKSLFAERKDDPIVLVYGKGTLLLETEYNNINEFTLRNESMFLEDERLLAFYGDLEWENGRIEVKSDKSINVTQVKGTASIFVGLHHSLNSIEVSTDHFVSVRLNALVGWYGKLIPKQTNIRHYNNFDYMSFYGEGVVFVDA